MAERDIEKRLRIAAEQRRGTIVAPFEMPQHVRNALMAELKRKPATPAVTTAAAAGPWTMLYRRVFAFAACGLVVVALGLWFLLPLFSGGNKKDMQLARAPKSERLQSGLSLDLKPDSAPAPAIPAATTAPSPQGVRTAESSREAVTFRATDKSKAAPDVKSFGGGSKDLAAAPSIGRSNAVTRSRMADTSNQTLYFQNQAGMLGSSRLPIGDAVETQNKPLGEQVLSYFRFEQSGNNLRIVDVDGSVYTGTVDVATSALQKDADRKAPDIAGQNRLFRVFGQNKANNQSVVFIGHILYPQNISVNSVGKGFLEETDMEYKGRRPGGGVQQATQPQVEGTAILGNGDKITVNAVPSTLR
jgi:hypothetical protein